MDSPQLDAGHDLSARLQKMSTELRELQTDIRSAEIDSRVLNDFRDAVDHARMSAWAVHQWLALREKRADPYSVLSLLAAERMRRAAQLSKDLTLDLDAMEVGITTEGIEDLFRASQELHGRLVRLFQK